jgi:hypothetical protein
MHADVLVVCWSEAFDGMIFKSCEWTSYDDDRNIAGKLNVDQRQLQSENRWNMTGKMQT